MKYYSCFREQLYAKNWSFLGNWLWPISLLPLLSWVHCPENSCTKILRIWLPWMAARGHDSQALSSHAWRRREIPQYCHILTTIGFRPKQMSILEWALCLSWPQFPQLWCGQDDETWPHRYISGDTERLATAVPEHRICQRKSTKGWGCWEYESGQLTMLCLWLSRRLSWRELPTLQRLSTVSLATTTSSQPLLTLRFMQEWWAWTPSVDNWLWMSLRHHKPPIKVRRLLFPSLPFPLPFDKLILPPSGLCHLLEIKFIYIIYNIFFFQERFFTYVYRILL